MRARIQTSLHIQGIIILFISTIIIINIIIIIIAIVIILIIIFFIAIVIILIVIYNILLQQYAHRPIADFQTRTASLELQIPLSLKL